MSKINAPAPMELWDAWPLPPGDATKHVSQRGGFTAINATWQQMEATRMWGPMGEGWGPTNVVYTERKDPAGNIIEAICSMDLFYDAGRATENGPPVIRGLRSGVKYRPGDDCDIKAWTHCISKGLSRLGQCAVIFLGKYDDLPPQVGGDPPRQSQQQPRRQAPPTNGGQRPRPTSAPAAPATSASGGRQGKGGIHQECPQCSTPGVTNAKWAESGGTWNGPDLECPAGCREQKTNKWPERWWSVWKGDEPIMAAPPANDGPPVDAYEDDIPF